MATCAMCGGDFSEARLVHSENGLVCESCEAESAPVDGFSPPVIGGLVAGVVPFFLSITTSSEKTVNGEIVEQSFMDYVALGGGGLAIVFGAVALKAAMGSSPKAMAPAVAALGLGVYQLLRGFGVL